MPSDQPEHLIRLRGGWRWRPCAAEAEASRRVDLPAPRPVDGPGPVLLTRHFQSPPLEAGRERVRLRLEAVAGLLAVRLNGRELARPGAGVKALVLDLEGHLRARNELVLEVDPAASAAEPGPWGVIALAIGPG